MLLSTSLASVGISGSRCQPWTWTLASRRLAGVRGARPSLSPSVGRTALGKWGPGGQRGACVCTHTHTPQHSEQSCKLLPDDCRALLESSRRGLWKPLEQLTNYALEAELQAGLTQYKCHLACLCPAPRDCLHPRTGRHVPSSTEPRPEQVGVLSARARPSEGLTGGRWGQCACWAHVGAPPPPRTPVLTPVRLPPGWPPRLPPRPLLSSAASCSALCGTES